MRRHHFFHSLFHRRGEGGRTARLHIHARREVLHRAGKPVLGIVDDEIHSVETFFGDAEQAVVATDHVPDENFAAKPDVVFEIEQPEVLRKQEILVQIGILQDFVAAQVVEPEVVLHVDVPVAVELVGPNAPARGVAAMVVAHRAHEGDSRGGAAARTGRRYGAAQPERTYYNSNGSSTSDNGDVCWLPPILSLHSNPTYRQRGL